MSMSLAAGARRSFPVPVAPSFARSGRFLVLIAAAAALAVLFLS